HYLGTGSFREAVSDPLPVVVTSPTPTPSPTPAAVNVDLRVSNGSPHAGDTVTLTAGLTSPGGVPDGRVEFLDGTTVVDTESLVNGVASYSTAPLTPGTHSYSVHYAGNSRFLAASQGPSPLTVTPTPTPTVAPTPTGTPTSTPTGTPTATPTGTP